MAAYDEVIYQLGDEHPDARVSPGLSWAEAGIARAAFHEGMAYERARITEELARSCNIIPLLLVHGEWAPRVSLFKWGVESSWVRAQQLRADARQTMADLRRYIGDGRG